RITAHGRTRNARSAQGTQSLKFIKSTGGVIIMQIEGTNGSYRDLEVQAIAIAVFKDEKADDGFLKDLDEVTGGVIKSVIDSEELKGKEAESVYLHLVGNSQIKAQRLLLVGVGERGDYTAAQASQMAGTA